MDNIRLSNGGGAGKYVLDLFFPNRCPFCDEIIPYDVMCCEDCFDEVPWADDSICPLCGKLSCICDRGLRYDMCIPAAYYEGKAQKAVLALKYRHHADAAEIFGLILRERLTAAGLLDSIDIAVPVPIYRAGRLERGYNQAKLLADSTVKGTDIPVCDSILGRTTPRSEQHTLSAEDRLKEAAEQYYLREEVSLEGKTVLLADDVLTTGATLDSCAALLKQAGAQRVICAAAVTVR